MATCGSNQLLCEQKNEMQLARCETNADRAQDQCVAGKEREHKDCLAEKRAYYSDSQTPEIYAQMDCEHALPSTCIREYCSSDNSNCVAPYRQCFSTCGGSVKARTVCVANCDQEVR